MNYLTKKPYRGINLLLLNSRKFNSPYWLTFNQAREMGGKVKKGEKSKMVVYANVYTKEDKINPDLKEIKSFYKKYSVFNAEQIEGVDFEKPYKQSEGESSILEAEKIINNWKVMPDVEHKMQKAFYMPSLDYINMPPKENFENMETYYQVLFHEMTHSTGHENRLNRKEITNLNFFGSHEYSKEELVAEFGAAYLSSLCGIETESSIKNHSSYIQGWLAELKNDSRMILHGIAKAQKAVDFILNEAPPS